MPLSSLRLTPQRRASSDLLESVIDQLPIGVILLDHRGRVLRFNRHEEYLSGLKREKVLGKSFFSEVAPCTEQLELEQLFREGIEQENLDLDFEFNFPHRYNRVPRDVRIRAQSVSTDGPDNASVHAVLIEDITSRSQLEQHNVEMLDGLRAVMQRSYGRSEGPSEGAKTLQVVALSARMAGFAEFATQFAPSELFQHVDSRLRAVSELITQAGGRIDAMTGEGVTAWFEIGQGQKQRGWFESAQCADRISKLIDRTGPGLQFAVGLCVGEVVHGPIGRAEFGNRTTIGRPVAIAKALSQVARPGEVLLEEDLLEGVGDTVQAEALRGFGVPGVPNHGSIYRLNELRLP